MRSLLLIAERSKVRVRQRLSRHRRGPPPDDLLVDPIHESMDALSAAYALLKSHEVIDLLIIMLGTNDVKERFGADAACISHRNGSSSSARRVGVPRPPTLRWWPRPVSRASTKPSWARAVWRNPPVWRSSSASSPSGRACTFWTPEGCKFNRIDFMHLTRHGHAQLAESWQSWCELIVKFSSSPELYPFRRAISASRGRAWQRKTRKHSDTRSLSEAGAYRCVFAF